MKVKILTTRHCKPKSASYNTVKVLEDAFLRCDGEDNSLVDFSPCIWKLNVKMDWLYGMLSRHIHVRLPHQFPDIISIGKITRSSPDYVLSVVMGLDDLDFMGSTLSRVKQPVVLYCYDVWESKYQEWMNLFAQIEPKCIFFAYKKAASYFSNRLRSVQCVYIPQSFDDTCFRDYGENKKEALYADGAPRGVHT